MNVPATAALLVLLVLVSCRGEEGASFLPATTSSPAAAAAAAATTTTTTTPASATEAHRRLTATKDTPGHPGVVEYRDQGADGAGKAHKKKRNHHHGGGGGGGGNKTYSMIRCRNYASAYSAAWLAPREYVIKCPYGDRLTLEWHSHNLYNSVHGASYKLEDKHAFFVNHMSYYEHAVVGARHVKKGEPLPAAAVKSIAAMSHAEEQRSCSLFHRHKHYERDIANKAAAVADSSSATSSDAYVSSASSDQVNDAEDPAHLIAEPDASAADAATAAAHGGAGLPPPHPHGRYYQNILGVVPFYPGATGNDSETGNAHSVSPSDIKALWLRATVCSMLAYMGHVLVGVCSEEHHAIAEKQLGGADFRHQVHVKLLDCKKPVFLPYVLLRTVQQQFGKPIPNLRKLQQPSSAHVRSALTWNETKYVYFSEMDNVLHVRDTATMDAMVSFIGPTGYVSPNRMNKRSKVDASDISDKAFLVNGQNKCARPG